MPILSFTTNGCMTGFAGSPSSQVVPLKPPSVPSGFNMQGIHCRSCRGSSRLVLVVHPKAFAGVIMSPRQILKSIVPSSNSKPPKQLLFSYCSGLSLKKSGPTGTSTLICCGSGIRKKHSP